MLVATERMPLAAALIVGGSLVVAGILVAALSRRLARGDVERNRSMGLRISSTMASDEAWQAGQEAFAPFGMAAGIGAALLGAGLFLQPPRAWAVAIAGFASIWLVVLPAAGAFAGDLAAKDATVSSES